MKKLNLLKQHLTNINENDGTSDDGLHVNQPAKHHIEAQSEDVTNHDELKSFKFIDSRK